MAEKKKQEAADGEKKRQRVQVYSRIRLISVDAAKNNDGQINGLELNVEMEDVKLNKQYVELWFKYTVTYKPDVGRIAMKGVLLLELDEKTAKTVYDYYTDNGYFDSPWAENIANNINFKCATEAIFPAKIIDLPPPIMPPRINMAGQPAPKLDTFAQRPAQDAPVKEATSEKGEKKEEKKKPANPFSNMPFPPGGGANPFTKKQ